MLRRLPPLPLALMCAALLTACGSSGGSSSSATSAGGSTTASSSGTAAGSATSSAAPVIGFEAVPIEPGPQLAPASTTSTEPVDGVSCLGSEQLAYHIHAHLAVYAHGTPYQLPGGIGIPGSVTQDTSNGPVATGGRCIYYLHTHAPDGIIHVESPFRRIYTLGTFFDEWHQPLSATQAGGLHGAIAALVNGKPWTRSPRAIPLLPHTDIQLDIGRPTAPIVRTDWSQTQL